MVEYAIFVLIIAIIVVILISARRRTYFVDDGGYIVSARYGGDEPHVDYSKIRTEQGDGDKIVLHITESCPHCVSARDVFEQITKEYEGCRFKFMENNEMENRTTGVNKVPTLAHVSGDSYNVYDGNMNYPGIKKWIESLPR